MIFTASGSSLEYAQEHTVRTCILYVYCMYGVQENQICPTISFCLLCPTYVEKSTP